MWISNLIKDVQPVNEIAIKYIFSLGVNILDIMIHAHPHHINSPAVVEFPNCAWRKHNKGIILEFTFTISLLGKQCTLAVNERHPADV